MVYKYKNINDEICEGWTSLAEDSRSISELEDEIANLKQELQQLKNSRSYRQTPSRSDPETDDISRRDFLKKLGAGVAGLGAMSLTPAASNMRITSNDILFNGDSVLDTAAGFKDLDNDNVAELQSQHADLQGGDLRNGGALGVKAVTTEKRLEPPTYVTLGDVPTDMRQGAFVFVEDEGRYYVEDGT